MYVCRASQSAGMCVSGAEAPVMYVLHGLLLLDAARQDCSGLRLPHAYSCACEEWWSKRCSHCLASSRPSSSSYPRTPWPPVGCGRSPGTPNRTCTHGHASSATTTSLAGTFPGTTAWSALHDLPDGHLARRDDGQAPPDPSHTRVSCQANSSRHAHTSPLAAAVLTCPRYL